MRETISRLSVALLLTAPLLLAQAEKPAAAPKKLPLTPERTIEFTTDEGTWLSLDLAPDGKTIAFELLGDIYTMPAAGGEAKPILTGMAMETQPRFSPDGKTIAFLGDRDGGENLWIANADGSNPRKLSRETRSEFASPAWTPDGEYVVVSKSSNLSGNELWMYHRSGGAGVQITKSKARPDQPRNEWNNDLGAVFTPDGKYLYFARRKQGFTYNATFPLWQLVRRNMVTGDEDTVTNAPGSAFSPRISPDGKWLVYATRYEQQTAFRIRELATGEERWLAGNMTRDDQESRATRDLMPGYSFTPDSQWLITTFGGKIHKVPVTSKGESPTIPFQAAVHLDLGPMLEVQSRVDDGPTVRSRLIMAPAVSADGSRVCFSSFARLYVAGADGSGVHRLTNSTEGEFHPAWSPDGKSLVYVTWSDTNGGSLWISDASGAQPRRLTNAAAFYRDPVFSPDGQHLFALRGAKQSRLEMESEFGGGARGLDLVEIPLTGGDPRVVLASRASGRPHFGPEPDRIYIYGQQGLQSLRFDGSDRRVLLKVNGANLRGTPEPPPARDVRISPRGDRALAEVEGQLWLIPVPHTGAEPPAIDVTKPQVPVRKLTRVGVDGFGWSPDGASLFIATGASLKRIQLSDAELMVKEAGVTITAPNGTETDFAIEIPRRVPQGVAVLRGARVITMRGDEVIENADIVVTNNRITAVGKRGSVSVPQGAKIIDLAGSTVIPGIIDVHAHWTEIRRGILDEQSWPFLANLAYGVTTGRDPQTGTNDTFTYQDLIEAGVIPGPRAFSTGPGVFAETDFQSLDEARDTVLHYAKYYRTNTLKSYMVGNRQQRQWMVTACKENKIMPTTEGGLDLKLDMTHAIDGFNGNEHALPIVPLYKDVVELFARSKIRYTPTLLVAYGGPWAENAFYEEKDIYSDPKLRRFIPRTVLYNKASRRPWFQEREHIYPRLAKEAAKVAAAGGSVTIGGHGQLQGIQCHWEMWALASGGMKNHDVLRAGTIRGAETIGYAQDLGSIEPGKLADLVVLKANPLDNIRNTESIRYVMKNGELFEGDTLDQIWPAQKPLPAMWWWNDRP